MFPFCEYFGFTADEGARAFAIAEIFLAIYNLFLGVAYSITAYRLDGILSINSLMMKQQEKYGNQEALDLLKKTKMSNVLYLSAYALIAAGALLQCIVGFALYPVGYLKKNMLVCWIWIGVAIFVLFDFLFLEVVLLAFEHPLAVRIRIGDNDKGDDRVFEWPSIFFAFFHLYSAVGIIVLLNFVRQKHHRVVIAVDSNSVPVAEQVAPEEDVYTSEQEEPEQHEHHHKRSHSGEANTKKHHHHHEEAEPNVNIEEGHHAGKKKKKVVKVHKGHEV